MIIVNTGNGKGKTTAAIGQIIRALGHKHNVCLIQLFKGENFYGEQNILLKLENLDFFSYCKKHPFCFDDVSVRQAQAECQNALEKLKEISQADKKYDLIVLDEFNIALRDNFIDKNAFINLVKKLSEKSDLIITGRGAPDELIDIADLVGEIKEIKHPYNKGIKAREGIEY
jgi:cob(I)alamin adenosyltransferase